MDEAEKCAYVYIMHEGKILRQGSPEQLKALVHEQTWQIKPSEQIKTRIVQAQLLEILERLLMQCQGRASKLY